MKLLRYPKELNTNDVDYVRFRPAKYTPNFKGTPPSTNGEAEIILYMPTSTPDISNGNGWNQASFEGPFGELRRDLGMGVVDIVNQETPMAAAQSAIDKLKSAVEGDPIGRGVAVGKQVALEAVGGALGSSANQLLALQRGEIYNPNIELIYQGPGLRSFNMSFTFFPKSKEEADTMNDIIFEFKKWSSPKKNEGGMYEVPHVWEVVYMTGSGKNKSMNRFKRAALSAVAVQANRESEMHVAYDEGVPVSTTIGLSFQEVDVITREDHEDVGGQGY